MKRETEVEMGTKTNLPWSNIVHFGSTFGRSSFQDSIPSQFPSLPKLLCFSSACFKASKDEVRT